MSGNATSSQAGHGGNGGASTISGASVTRGGGGGGGKQGSPATGNGTIEMSSAQNLSGEDNDGVGSVMTFGDFYTAIDLSVSFTISKPESTNRTITLLLDNFITPGAAS